MRRQLRDRELSSRVWPDYTFGCERILFSSAFLPALARSNVELVTEAVTAVGANGVVASDGVLHEADVLIYATGLKTNDFMFPMEVTGREGRSLRDDWAAGAHAHLGMTVPGYPSNGRIVANWPGYMGEYLRATRELDPSEYVLTPAPRPVVASI